MKDKLLNLSKKTGYHLTLLTAFSYFLFPYFPPKISIKVLGKYVSATQVLMLLAFGFTTAYFYQRWKAGGLKLSNRFRLIYILLFTSLAVMSVSTIFAGLSAGQLFIRLSSLAAIIIITFLFSFLPPKKINILIFMMSAVALTSSVLGILQFYFFGNAVSPAYWLGDRGAYAFATGFANYSSLFGASMALFSPLFWGLAVADFLKKQNLWMTTACFSVVGLVLSLSRSALLGGVVGAIVILYWAWKGNFNKKFIIKSIVILLLSLSLALFYVPPEGVISPYLSQGKNVASLVGDRFKFVGEASSIIFKGGAGEVESGDGRELSELSDYSAYSRLAFHQAAWGMMSDSPRNFLFGLGIGGFGRHWLDFEPSSSTLDAETPDPHSVFLEVLVSGGVLGFAFLALFFGFLYHSLIKEKYKNLLAIPLLSGLTALLVDGAFHTSLYNKYLWILVGVSISIICMEYASFSKKDVDQ